MTIMDCSCTHDAPPSQHEKKAHDTFVRHLLPPRSWMQDLQRLRKMVAGGKS